MRRWTRVLGALVVVLCLVAAGAACNRDKKAAKKKGGGEAPAAGETTSTTADPGPRVPAPLTGLPTTEANAKRALLVVKVDNDPSGRQHGLAEADVVYEQMIEGGVTRFAALYHSTDAPLVGPVRSARSTDVNIATSFNRPLFAYSGANAVFRVLLRKAVFVDVGLEAAGPAYHRRDDYRAPGNLFASTDALFKAARFPGTTPPALWAFRPAGTPAAAGDVAAKANVTFPGPAATKVSWVWDAAAGVWMRQQSGTPHLDGNGKALSAVNVIVQFTPYKDSRIRDQSRAPVPEAELVGSGEAWFLTDGKIIRGRWEKQALTKHTTYTDAAGKPIELTTGRTWVELAPPGSASL